MLGEPPSLRAGGRLRGVCQEPGHLENPAKVEEGEVEWYPGHFPVLNTGWRGEETSVRAGRSWYHCCCLWDGTRGCL